MRAFVIILRRALAQLVSGRSASRERRRTNRRVRPAGLPGLRQSAVRTGGL